MTLLLADGGEGTVETLVQAKNGTDGELVKKEVVGHLKEKVDVIYGILCDEKTAVIEVL
ncbi:glycerate kinase [Peribacillus butanolivorans]|uniref:glycerate kinase n=1 Tax=Peribacillus butanolivorans TaxID=421767 RepID=UPI002E1B4931|nr:glycerate kinase [Peribacillus butanolivorans]MED3691974.1 glycerate kinase [Peribacillus butanolivorans]